MGQLRKIWRWWRLEYHQIDTMNFLWFKFKTFGIVLYFECAKPIWWLPHFGLCNNLVNAFRVGWMLFAIGIGFAKYNKEAKNDNS